MALLSEIYPLQTGPSGATGPVGATGPLGATGPQGIGVTGATGPIPPGLFYATGDQVISGEKTFLADSFVFSGANVQFIEGTGTVSGAWNFQVRPTLNNHGLISVNDLSGLAQNVIPATSGVYDLGTSAKPFKDLYLSSGSLYLGEAVITASGTSVVLPQNTVIQGGGALGATGPQGATGPAGADGSTGATGPAGSNGATGATGTAGSNGATGATGEAGSQGATGATGTAGANGATGATGTAGVDGATGATGTAGSQGATGATGLGATGATGVAGVAGDKYTTTSTTSESIGTGSKTFTVETGLALSIGQQIIVAYDASNKMEGSVTSYSGSTLVVNVTSVTGSGGPYTSWSISLSGAPGPAGATGVGTQGATGATGTAGSNGATGATGNTGGEGATGATGTAGSNGATGATGVGTQGATGATGTAGGNGATGATGTAGGNGATGATGTAGSNGTNGATGATGPVGPAGVESIMLGWNPATDQNLGQDTDRFAPYNGSIWNTSTNVFEVTNSNSSVPMTRVQIKETGYYLFTVQFYGYDLKSNFRMLYMLFKSTTSSGNFTPVRYLSRKRYGEGADSALLSDEVSMLIRIDTANEYYAWAFNADDASPYSLANPGDGMYTMSMQITKLRGL